MSEKEPQAIPAATFHPSRQFEINISEEAIDKVKEFARITDLHPYLRNLPDRAQDLDQNDENFGIPPSRLFPLLERLKNRFDWREWEKQMNAMGEHGKMLIENVPDEGDVDLHYVLTKSSNPKAIPLLMVHGWPYVLFPI